MTGCSLRAVERVLIWHTNYALSVHNPKNTSIWNSMSVLFVCAALLLPYLSLCSTTDPGTAAAHEVPLPYGQLRSKPPPKAYVACKCQGACRESLSLGAALLQ